MWIELCKAVSLSWGFMHFGVAHCKKGPHCGQALRERGNSMICVWVFSSKSLHNPFVKEKDSFFLRLDDLFEVPEHRYLLRALTKLTWLKMSLFSAGGWTRSPLKVPSNPNSPVIYRTEAWLLDKEACREALNHGNLISQLGCPCGLHCFVAHSVRFFVLLGSSNPCFPRGGDPCCARIPGLSLLLIPLASG